MYLTARSSPAGSPAGSPAVSAPGLVAPVGDRRIFWLGIHQPHWLAVAGVPTFLSRRRLAARRNLPRAAAPWALDSGAFTEIRDRGGWTITAAQYAAEVERYSSEIGNMLWAAIQDWMCEPFMLARTGKTILQHQELTMRSYLDLASLSPSIPWTPVIQGYSIDDYLRHVDMYANHGVDLAKLPIVGLGSVCKRQATDEVSGIVRALSALGISLHGFGVKTQGLAKVSGVLRSADSLAWSFKARRLQRPALARCVGGGHKNCANCLPFALHWRSGLLSGLPASWGDFN